MGLQSRYIQVDLEVLRWVSIYLGPIDLLCGSYHQKPANRDREGGKKPPCPKHQAMVGRGVTALVFRPFFCLHPEHQCAMPHPYFFPSLCNPNLVIRETLPTPFYQKLCARLRGAAGSA